MKSLILTAICFLALATITEANPRPVALRGAAVRGAGIRNAANVINRALFPGATLRTAAFNQRFAFRNTHFAFRSHYQQPFAAYSSAFYAAPFIQSYAAPLAFSAPAYASYTQPYAAEVNPCGGAYTQSFVQPFAAYQAYGVSPFLSYASLGYGRFLGFNNVHGGYHRAAAFRFGR